MGFVIDTSVLIAHTRQRKSIDDLVQELSNVFPGQNLSVSVMTIAELTHGVYRPAIPKTVWNRQTFIDDLCRDIAVRPLTLAIARLIGKIEGQQKSVGISIDLPDLIIGATALHHGDTVLTLNTRHFNFIPGLSVRNP